MFVGVCVCVSYVGGLLKQKCSSNFNVKNCCCKSVVVGVVAWLWKWLSQCTFSPPYATTMFQLLLLPFSQAHKVICFRYCWILFFSTGTKKISTDMLWICYKYFRDFVGSTALTHYSLLQNFELHLLTSKFWASSAQFCLFCFVGLSFTWANSSSDLLSFNWLCCGFEFHKLSFVCLISFGFAELNLWDGF